MADTTLKLVEVITSPERTETLKVDRQDLRGRQSRREGRDHLAALGRRPSRSSQPWSRPATRRTCGDARPLAVALCQQWHAGEPRALSRQVGAHQGPERPRPADGPLRQATPPMPSPTASICARMFYNKKLFKEAGVSGPPKTLDEFVEAAKKVSALPGKYGYCLRGGPGGLNGWMMFGATANGDNTFFKRGRHLDHGRSGLGQGRLPCSSTSTRTAMRRRTASTGASTRSSRASIPAPAPCSTRIRTR